MSSPQQQHQQLEVMVRSVTWESPLINSWELRLPGGGELPPFEAGAHIDVHLANGMIRSYSLVNSENDRDRYVIAVQKDRASRGGSRFLHEKLHAGHKLPITAPRNNFPLEQNAPHSLLIAGGIGITPILCMTRRLTELGKSWELIYCSRTRDETAFLDDVAKLEAASAGKGKVRLNFDHEPGGKMLDIPAVFAAAAKDTHFYCCGPIPMLEAFEKSGAGRPPEQVHLEYFTAKEAPATAGGFTVALAKSGKEVFVPEGKTILDALLDAGIDAPYSCTEGVCGTCEIRVLEGTPDHRDLVLTTAEREASKTMMICCSGSKSARLVLDL